MSEKVWGEYPTYYKQPFRVCTIAITMLFTTNNYSGLVTMHTPSLTSLLR